MSLTPQDVERKTFKERFKGYDMGEVDAFLDRVVERLHELLAERDGLRRRLHEAEQGSGESEQLLQRTLITAQRAADETLAEAQAQADRLRDEARAEHDRAITEAREEAARERDRLAAEGEQLARSIEDLKAFRARYLERVREVIQEQLDALGRVSVLPKVPDEIEELTRSLTAAAEAQPPGGQRVIEPPPEDLEARSVLDNEPEVEPRTDVR